MDNPENRREFIKKAITGGVALASLGCFSLRGINSMLCGLHSSPATAFAAHAPDGNTLSSAMNSSARNSSATNHTEARYYTRLERSRVRCDLCHHRCMIANGDRGFCRVRENDGGRLYSLVYGSVAGLQIDPIEKEPMHHMYPGHHNLCVFTASCNFRCRHCHNWQTSQRAPDEITPRAFSPGEIVNLAISRGTRSISHSINEPTIFYEYMYDISRHAQREGLNTLFHTNGYMREEPLRELLRHMDGVTVDLKAFTDDFYQQVSSAALDPVLQTLKVIREEKVHLEIVYLVIPTLNDDPGKIGNMAAWVRDELGPEIPVHLNRFTPTYQLTNLPSTPVETLEKAAKTARDAGLKFVYVGNVPGHRLNSTFCPGCGERLIHRTHFYVEQKQMENGRCTSCGYEVYGLWS